MGKKKNKKFNYSNSTHSHGYYPPLPFEGQRYPHTNLHEQDPFWVYREMGIYKDWLISLTKLLGMIAQMETDDELKDVYNFGVIENALKMINNCLALIYTILNRLPEHFSNLFWCIEDRLDEDDKNIYNIFMDLQNQFNASYKNLTEGEDFEVFFFNGFRYSDEEFGVKQSLSVQLNTTELLNKIFYTIKIGSGHGSNSNHAITNDYVYTKDSSSETCPSFSHGNDWRDHPEFWVLLIKFKGDYEFLNNLTNSSIERGSSPIFNMLPLSARASWVVNLNANLGNIYTNDGSINMGNGLLLTLGNIADGINVQYYTYCQEGLAESISFGSVLNIDLSVMAS